MEVITQEILNLVKKKMEEQGGYNMDAYRQYVSETIEYFIERGKISEDDNTQFIEDKLIEIWPQVEKNISRGY
jgi:polyhydroxyalkanoate synthesis regulator phasin